MSRDKDRLPTRRHQGEPMNFFTIAEVAEHLNVATRTVRRWTGDVARPRSGQMFSYTRDGG